MPRCSGKDKQHNQHEVPDSHAANATGMGHATLPRIMSPDTMYGNVEELVYIYM